MSNILDIYLVRHSESDKNLDREHICGRSSETPLSINGRFQGILLGVELNAVRFDQAYSSTAVRSYDTAILSLHGKKIKIVKVFELEEMDQGDWEGLNRTETYSEEVIKEISKNPLDFKAPNGESKRDCGLRMDKWFQETIMSQYPCNKKIAIFGHGTLFRCWLQRIMQFDPKMIFPSHMGNGSVTRLQYKDGQWALICYGWAPPNSTANPLIY